jgi:hypothetical protein
MKNKFKILSLFAAAVVGCSLLCQQAHAIPISGSISFTGNGSASVSGGTTTITPTSPWTIVGGTGDYLGVSGTAAFNPISYTGTDGSATLTAPVVPLWIFTIGAVTYSFDLTSLLNANTVVFPTTTTGMTGTGVAHITGRDNTVATWSLSGGGAFPDTLTFAFSTTSSTGAGVPDGGLTVAFLGFALVGVEGLRRKLRK